MAANERRKVLGWLAESGVSDDLEGWLAGTEEVALEALTARGEATAAELAADDPRLRVQITLARGTKYEGTQNVSSRVLFLLAAQGKVVRGRPRGTWTSHQYRWAPLTAWCPQGLLSGNVQLAMSHVVADLVRKRPLTGHLHFRNSPPARIADLATYKA